MRSGGGSLRAVRDEGLRLRLVTARPRLPASSLGALSVFTRIVKWLQFANIQMRKWVQAEVGTGHNIQIAAAGAGALESGIIE